MATRRTHALFFTEEYWDRSLKGERHEKEHRFAAHFVPGIFYLVVYFVAGLLIARL